AFIEDADNRNCNLGTWVQQWNTNTTPQSFTWVDPPAMYHGDQNTASFTDGHSELHQWKDPAVIKAGKQAASGIGVSPFPGPTSGADYKWVRSRYRHPNNP